MTQPSTIPGPPGLPLLGPMGSLLRFFRDPIRCMRALQGEHGALAAVSRGDPSLICAFGPELNQTVLSNQDVFENAADLPVRTPAGSSLHRLTRFLVGMNGTEHRALRRTMLPLFHKTQLERYHQRLVEATESRLSTWTHGRQFDLSAATAEIALTVAFRCFFSLDVRSNAASLARMALQFTDGATSVVNAMVPLEIPGTPYWRFMRLCERLEAHFLSIIRVRREQAVKLDDVLSALLNVEDDEGRPLPEPLVVGLVNELFIAGHETTARTLGWTLLLLQLHPQALGDVLDELSEVLHGEPPTLDQLPRLVRLDAVIKESMRILPATPFLFFRKLSSEAQLGGYTLPRGARVVISPLMTHHMPEVYPEPRRFRPERWHDINPSPYEYLPFGAGPRMCLGYSFASMTLRVVLAMVLQRFSLEAPPAASVSFKTRGVILGAKAGLPMIVHAYGKGGDRGPRTGLPNGNLDQLLELP